MRKRKTPDGDCIGTESANKSRCMKPTESDREHSDEEEVVSEMSTADTTVSTNILETDPGRGIVEGLPIRQHSMLRMVSRAHNRIPWCNRLNPARESCVSGQQYRRTHGTEGECMACTDASHD